MALNFKMVAPAQITPKTRMTQFDEEFLKEFEEVWEAFIQNPDLRCEVEFPNHTERVKWFTKAVRYGRTRDIYVRKIKGTDSDNKEHGKLTFIMESEAQVKARIEERKRSQERYVILNAHGHAIKRGKKMAEDIALEDEVLKKHYAMTKTQQDKKIADYTAKKDAEKNKTDK